MRKRAIGLLALTLAAPLPAAAEVTKGVMAVTQAYMS